jgi:ATP-dependent Clp protease ATP-binding subunit ClpA
VRLLQRGRRRIPPATKVQLVEPYLAASAAEARDLGHNYVGTEHLLLALVREPRSGATQVLRELAVPPDAVERSLAAWLPWGARATGIDPDALATLGIDFEAVRERLEQSFGQGALERTHAGRPGVCPGLKKALTYALDHGTGARSFADEHILLGMLSVPDSVAARVLGEFGVSFEAAQAVLDRTP